MFELEISATALKEAKLMQNLLAKKPAALKKHVKPSTLSRSHSFTEKEPSFPKRDKPVKSFMNVHTKPIYRPESISPGKDYSKSTLVDISMPAVAEKDPLSRNSVLKSTSSSSKRLSKMQAKLNGGRFRYLNELLYTTKSRESFQTFQKEPNLFDEYHKGFQAQVTKWPVNPLDVIIRKIQNYRSQSNEPLFVADMGCGEAAIAKHFQHNKKFRIQSFDLVAANDFITAVNISHTPCKDSSMDVVVFCLSLMGTDFIDFLKEGYRILKQGGALYIAEVVSRIEDKDKFISMLKSMGFKVGRVDDSNKMFVMMECEKTTKPKSGTVEAVELKACKYKRR